MCPALKMDHGVQMLLLLDVEVLNWHFILIIPQLLGHIMHDFNHSLKAYLQ